MAGTRRLFLALIVGQACGRTVAPPAAPAPLPAPGTSAVPVLAAPGASEEVQQLVVVTTPAWDSTSGTLRRFTRVRPSLAWRADGEPVQVVVGQAGLAWGADTLGHASQDPRKHEGDGRAPAGMFPLDTVFGFAPTSAVSWIRLPYLELGNGSECVDDSTSTHYNTIVDRGAMSSIDWTSAEHMRRIDQYRLGVTVGYNASPPRRGRGSCIFLHIWAGPTTPTSGCTAFPASEVEALVRWLDPRLHPLLVQLPAAEYTRLRERWHLP